MTYLCVLMYVGFFYAHMEAPMHKSQTKGKTDMLATNTDTDISLGVLTAHFLS